MLCTALGTVINAGHCFQRGGKLPGFSSLYVEYGSRAQVGVEAKHCRGDSRQRIPFYHSGVISTRCLARGCVVSDETLHLLGEWPANALCVVWFQALCSFCRTSWHLTVAHRKGQGWDARFLSPSFRALLWGDRTMQIFLLLPPPSCLLLPLWRGLLNKICFNWPLCVQQS